MKKKATIIETVIYKCYSLLGHTCRILLNIFSLGELNKERKVSDINLMFFTGKKGARMLKPVLLSVYKRWKEIPNVTIVSDGTPKELISRYMKFWPFPFEIKSWEDCAAHHHQKGHSTLVQFAEHDVFGKKFISILAQAELKPTLYCDTDVLWFSEPTIPQSGKGAFTFRMATDNLHYYHIPLLQAMNEEELMVDKPLNAGVIFISGSLFDHSGFIEKMADVLGRAEGLFLEQTAFAMIAKHYGDTWTLNDIILTIEDTHWPIIPKYFWHNYETLFARHHVLTKNSWFWRDALYLFLTRGSKKNKQPVFQIRTELNKDVQ